MLVIQGKSLDFGHLFIFGQEFGSDPSTPPARRLVHFTSTNRSHCLTMQTIVFPDAESYYKSHIVPTRSVGGRHISPPCRTPAGIRDVDAMRTPGYPPGQRTWRR